jgi:hypothetical protein
MAGHLVGSKMSIAELYNRHFERYLQLLSKLYENLDYYKGKHTVTSFTQTKEYANLARYELEK